MKYPTWHFIGPLLKAHRFLITMRFKRTTDQRDLIRQLLSKIMSVSQFPGTFGCYHAVMSKTNITLHFTTIGTVATVTRHKRTIDSIELRTWSSDFCTIRATAVYRSPKFDTSRDISAFFFELSIKWSYQTFVTKSCNGGAIFYVFNKIAQSPYFMGCVL